MDFGVTAAITAAGAIFCAPDTGCLDQRGRPIKPQIIAVSVASDQVLQRGFGPEICPPNTRAAEGECLSGAPQTPFFFPDKQNYVPAVARPRDPDTYVRETYGAHSQLISVERVNSASGNSGLILRLIPRK